MQISLRKVVFIIIKNLNAFPLTEMQFPLREISFLLREIVFPLTEIAFPLREIGAIYERTAEVQIVNFIKIL